MPKITKVTTCSNSAIGGDKQLRQHVINLENTINQLIYNIHNTTNLVLADRNLTLESGNGIDITPSGAQSLAQNRSWTISLKDSALIEFIKTLSITDYDEDIIGEKNRENTTYYLSHNYVPKTTKIYINGIRMKPGDIHDYIEVGLNIIKFNFPLWEGDEFTVDYIIK